MNCLVARRAREREIGSERDLQRQGAQQAEAGAERAVELAQERVVPAHERL